MEEQKPIHRGTQNLKPFKPGQCGNPNGRPKGRTSLATILKRYLEQEVTLKVNPITGEQNVKIPVKDMLILSLIKRASQGSDRALELILDRIDGKIPINLQNDSSESPGNVQVMVNFFKLIEVIGKDDRIRDRLAKTLESTEALQIRESLQDPDQESEIRESEAE